MSQLSRWSATAPLALFLLLTGCADGRLPRDLNGRLQRELAPELASGGATLEQLPDGARVTVADQTLFPTGGTALDTKGRLALASLVEALLAPALLQVDVAGPAGTLPQARAAAVAEFLRDTQVAPNLLFISLQQETPGGAAAPQATTVTVTSPGRSSRTDHPT
jgi:outer membrane protein OmpA-like peptidoglycan-associated protein